MRETQLHQTHVYGADNAKIARSTYVLGTWAAPRGNRDEALNMFHQAVFHGLDSAHYPINGERSEPGILAWGLPFPSAHD